MCGIAGILSVGEAARVEEGELRTMAGQIVHRGPDDEGYYVDARERCGLAFRRLAIIDLVGGNQPIANEDGAIHVVFNGEIYNFRELRRDLESAGHFFRTNTDTETIVHGFEQWGTGVFSRLHGMFAIAIWDSRNGKLVLARDRLGKKPLVIARFGGRLYFASELKAILALPGVPREIDRAALHEYFVLQYVAAPRCIYRGFEKILPGHFVEIDAASGAGEQTAYWSLDAGRYGGDYDAAKQRLGELLKRAVEKRLVADVPLGAFLSGGIDSSIVVGLMRKLGVSPLRTFSIGFDVAAYDETAHARRVAEHFQTEHHEERVTPQAREILDTLAFHFDEPMADSSAIPTYYVSKYTRKSVTVALTGDGGDECFAGYDRYRAMLLAERMDALPRGVRTAIARVGARVATGESRSALRRAARFAEELGGDEYERYLRWMALFRPDDLSAGYSPEMVAALGEETRHAGAFERIFTQTTGTPAERANRVDVVTYLPYDLNVKVDIASMACSLECRAPFLDHELLEFALSLPMEWKLNARGGKRILKDWARDLLPSAILKRRKMGFGVPVGAWFRGELREVLEGALRDRDALCRKIFRAEWLENLLQEHLSGRRSHDHRLWSLLMLELWNRRWKPTL